MELYSLIQNGISLIEVIAFFLSVLVLHKFPRERRVLILFLILLLTLVSEFTSSYLYNKFITDDTKSISSFGIYNLYNAIVYPLWIYLYYLLLGRKRKIFCMASIVAYLISLIIEGIFFLDYRVYLQIYPHIIGSLVVSMVVMIYFIKILKEGSAGKLFDNPFFWVSCGLLFYYVVNIPFRLVSNYFAFNDEVRYVLFYIKIITAGIMYILISLGLYKYLVKHD